MNDYLIGEDYNCLSFVSCDLVKQVGGLDCVWDIIGYKQCVQIICCIMIEGQEWCFFLILVIVEMEFDVVESGFVFLVIKVLVVIFGFDLIWCQVCKGDQCVFILFVDLMKVFVDVFSFVVDVYVDGKLIFEEKVVCVDCLEILLDQGVWMFVILNG